MIKPFDKIDSKKQEKLLKLLRAYTVNFPKNKKIISFKDKDEIGIILNGHIQIIRNNDNGTTTLIEELYEDSLVELSISYSKNDEYSVIAKADTQMLLINYNELIDIDINDKAYNQFIKNLFIILNDMLNEKNERINILTKKTIRNKLLEYFNVNSKKNGSRYVYLPFNFSDLAAYLSIDRCAMSRELNYLKEEGFIEINGKKITLLYKQHDIIII